MNDDELLPIGRVAERTGVAVSAIRFYESRGLITATRDGGGHRRFHRSTIRRISFILIAQRLGYSLGAIQDHFDGLPGRRTPSEEDWQQLAVDFGADIEGRIAELTRLKDSLSGCIGCGCLSLKRCAIYNEEDRIGAQGAGPRYLLGDSPGDIESDTSDR